MEQRRVSDLLGGCYVSIRWRTICYKRIGTITNKWVGGTRLLWWQGFVCVRRWRARRWWLLVIRSVRCHFTGITIRREHALWSLGCSRCGGILVWIWIGPLLLFSRRKYCVKCNSTKWTKLAIRIRSPIPLRSEYHKTRNS